MKNEWLICPYCKELITLQEKDHFLSQAEISKLEENGIADKIYHKSDPQLFSYCVAGRVYVWNGLKWRKTTQKFDPEKYV